MVGSFVTSIVLRCGIESIVENACWRGGGIHIFQAHLPSNAIKPSLHVISTGTPAAEMNMEER